MGGEPAGRGRGQRRDPPGGERAGARHGEHELSEHELSEHELSEHELSEHELSEHELSEHELSEQLFREHWWAAVAAVTRLAGDLDLAEDAVQEACCVAVERWPGEGLPGNPRAWLIGVARHKALDRLRRDARREVKEADASRQAAPAGTAGDGPTGDGPLGDDELALIFTCCHPALDRAVRLPLTLRSVAGLSTQEVAAAFLVPEPTMAKRLSRAKAKIRQAGIPFRVPAPDVLPARLADVLRVIYVLFTQGHSNTRGPGLIRAELCDSAIRLARRMHELIPDPETAGLLALLLLTDARRPARTDTAGDVVLLEDQDRRLWNQQAIAEGDALLQTALAAGRPGVYQLWAAIAACHSTARTAAQTDWRQIASLYGELIRYEPTAVVEANRAVAVAMAEGPAAGLVILDTISGHPQLKRWPQLYVARADLLRRLGRPQEAAAAYTQALELEPPPAERAFIQRRLRQLPPAGLPVHAGAGCQPGDLRAAGGGGVGRRLPW